jgi:hypothetical protein
MPKLYPFDTGRAILTVDRVIAAVRLVEAVVFDEAGPNAKLSDASSILQMTAEILLQGLRDELEGAEMNRMPEEAPDVTA